MKTTGNRNRELDSALITRNRQLRAWGCSLCCFSTALLSIPLPSPAIQFPRPLYQSHDRLQRTQQNPPACVPVPAACHLCEGPRDRLCGGGGSSWRARSCAGLWGGCAVWTALPSLDGAPVEVGRGWVLTLWSSWALAFGCCSWPGSTVSGPRYRLRDDGLMRPRSWQSEDSWGGEGGPSLTSAWGASGIRGWETPAGRGMGSAARRLAP